MTVLAPSQKRSRPVAPVKTSSIKELVARAADIVAPVWPLKTFIAVNPLQGLEHLPFEQAVTKANRHLAASSSASAGCEAVNRELIKWCSAFFDEGQATIVMPGRASGFYRAFRDLARYDKRLNGTPGARAILAFLPESAEDAIGACLEQCGVHNDSKEAVIRQGLAALPGWSGYVKWKEHWQRPAEKANRPATLVDYAAVRMVLTRILWPEGFDADLPDAPEPSYLATLPVREATYRHTLLGRLRTASAESSSTEAARADAQLVFCIDVRSEPFRRAIEAQGNYETLSMAGFFGLPVQLKSCDDDQPYDSCPVLVQPCHAVAEHAVPSQEGSKQRHERGRALLRMPKSFYQGLKTSFATPFALVEMLGPWLGMRMFARTFAPSQAAAVAATVQEVIRPPLATAPALDHIAVSQRADYAESALRIMGLTEKLAPLVVICGHGSTTTNNAFASALDCGACGGNHGGGNARILAAILNDPAVRSRLAERGFTSLAGTLFVAAQHDTTTDCVELFSQPGVSAEQQQRLDALAADLARARVANATARMATLGLPKPDGHKAVRASLRRSRDWAETRPEWGLARNAAFIVGPRELTRSLDLEGRCFLHSYRWQSDPDGKFLAAILTAPGVVAQWINSQYMFSTLDNVAYGSGSKVTQNVTGKLGVMQGNASDLMHGLSLQSVFAADGQPYHEPLRLLTVVHAPRRMLDAIIHTQEVLKKLLGNGWITLACIDPSDHRALVLNRDLRWEDAG